MRITQVSESTFTVKGHGVHTAFVEMVDALNALPEVNVMVNRFGKADITHIHTVGFFSLAFLLFSSGKKVVSAHVVPESLRGSLVGANIWLPLASWYLRWFYNRADMVFAVSESTKRELERLGVRTPVKVVCNLINTDAYTAAPHDRKQARSALRYRDTDWIVIGAGQVQPRKGIDSFISVANACPDMKFIWVGGMPFGKLAADNTTMQKLIDTAPDNVLVTGVIPHEQMRQYYHAADVFWLPSVQETFGLVVVEAAAAGLPVVLRDIPDYKETFADYVVLGTDATFTDLLRRLRDDKAFYEYEKKNAHKIVARFGRTRGIERVLKVYKQTIDGK